MNGCDRIDQMLSYYNIFNRKTVKWWKRIFVWSLEVAQVNSYILFCLTRDEREKPVNLLKYKKLLVNQLLAEADTIKPLDQKQHKIARPNILLNSNQPSHLVKWVKNDRNCLVFSGPGQRKRTNYDMCDTCNVYLHAKECFGAFHSARSFDIEQTAYFLVAKT